MRRIDGIYIEKKIRRKKISLLYIEILIFGLIIYHTQLLSLLLIYQMAYKKSEIAISFFNIA